VEVALRVLDDRWRGEVEHPIQLAAWANGRAVELLEIGERLMRTGLKGLERWFRQSKGR
jgi:hypothetical protein